MTVDVNVDANRDMEVDVDLTITIADYFKIVEMKNLDQEKLNLYYNACDVFLSTSLWEGSPNTIKEAMACNANIISTNVGDVKYLFGKEKYNRVCTFDPLEISTAITNALRVKKENNKGRERLIHLSLQGTDVAQKLINTTFPL